MSGPGPQGDRTGRASTCPSRYQERCLLSGVTTADHPYTVVINTDTFSRAFLTNLVQVSIVPAAVARPQAEKFAQNPIGTGPYRFVEYQSGQHLTLQANDQHWRAAPRARQLTFRMLAENATRMAALESGEVMLADNVPPDATARLKARPELDVAVQTTTRFMHLQMVESHPPFDNPKVRLAFNHAIDKQGIWKSIIGGLGAIQTAPWPSNMLGFNDQLQPFAYDPDKAKQLLSEAGVTKLAIKYGGPSGRYLNDKLVSEAIITQLGKVGVQADPDIREFGSFLQNVAIGSMTSSCSATRTAGSTPRTGASSGTASRAWPTTRTPRSTICSTRGTRSPTGTRRRPSTSSSRP
jgi:peptide/nickel transport system substrate-binding protein